MSQKKHIHFMGIAGSGMSAVAQIAAAQGYDVSGCDLNLDSPYYSHLKSNIPNIKSYSGHDPSHLDGVDLLAVTPAVFYQNNQHPEVKKAQEQGILIKWQDFLGQYLHRDKYLISVAGTHGKSTTTSMIGLLLEAAGFDPTVEVGATVSAWHNNVRIGKSKYFVSEADEFHNNFASYQSDIIVLTLLEMDHPEYFNTEAQLITTYQKFIDNRKANSKIIVYSDSPLVTKLVLPSNTIYYSPSQVENLVLDTSGSTFSYLGNKYHLLIPGRHNVSNSQAVIILAQILNIDPAITTSTLKSFSGTNRRLELLGQPHGIHIYDDYANHPSSFAASISAIKQLHPNSHLITIIEPHTFSRLRVLLHQLPDAVKQANEIIISRIFASRESDPGDFTGQDIVNSLNHPNATYVPEFSDIVQHLKSSSLSPNTVILVMGSGNSYQLSRSLLAAL